MKLIVQIPCLNEEATLPQTLAGLPRQVAGVDQVEWLVIDDGSTDRTAEVARAHGVDHVVRHPANYGLARAFATGLDASLRLGADIVVNTDADNQYPGAEVGRLIEPILAGRADMVVADRDPAHNPEFGPTKRLLQRLGSWVVRKASSTDVPDAASGFRALSRDAALRLNVVSDFTYTLETLIQAGHRNITVAHVPVQVNPTQRRSRLFGSVGSYVSRSAATIARIYAMYRPLKVFFTIGVTLTLAGVAVGSRFLYYYVQGDGQGKVQSLLFAVLMIVVGLQTCLTGLLADLIGRNRRLLEETLWRVRKLEIDGDRAGDRSPRPAPGLDGE